MMPGFGTVINTAAIVAGGIIGLFFQKALNQRIQDTLMKATGVCVLFIGVGGAMEEMLQVTEKGLESSGTMMLIASFALGALAGEWLDIEGKLEQFGGWLRRVSRNEGDSQFIDGFVSASLTVCIGAMAVVGAINDGLFGDSSILAAKAVLDLIIVMVMAASMGKGCIFSAVPVALFQGAITLAAGFLSPLVTDRAMSNLSFAGSVLIFCVGVNLVWGKMIRVANLLPALIAAVLIR